MATTRISTKLIAAVVTLISAVAYADGDYKWGESFEKFDFAEKPNGQINGTTCGSDIGTWSAGHAGSVVVVKDKSLAGHRSSLLSITDQVADQRNATLTLANPIVCPTSSDGNGGIPFSVMVRRRRIADDVELSGLNIDFQFTGEKSDGTKVSAWTSGEGGSGIIHSDMPCDKWFRLEGRLITRTYSPLQGQLAGAKVVNVEDESVQYNVLRGSSAKIPYAKVSNAVGNLQLTQIKFMTWSAGQAIIDIDDIRVGDYEYPPVPGLMILVL